MVADPTRPSTWIVPSESKLSLSKADLMILVSRSESSVPSESSRSEAMAVRCRAQIPHDKSPKVDGSLNSSAAGSRKTAFMKKRRRSCTLLQRQPVCPAREGPRLIKTVHSPARFVGVV